ncbi:L,D-transpeptidase [Demequina salsinemoris]|uniref:L,D-transpeptidase n=1 Tax=Demequina salsinemoris TaxID=577470 RepID=UPI00078638CF|nr:L,D-transpeptidase [Demequina salsinemoris]
MRTSTVVRRALALAAVLALSACYSAPSQEAISASHSSFLESKSASEAASAAASAADIVTYSLSQEDQDNHVSYIVTSQEQTIDVYDSANGEVSQTIDAADVLTVPDSTPLTFLVKTRASGWYEVYLPVRPNGTTGWVKADDVKVATTQYWVEVDVANFELTVWDGTEEQFSTEIGVGRDDRPTPGGVYYIRELLAVPDSTGVYGPYAYGLSGFQPVLDSFNGGDAVIGIHGTNEPDKLGSFVSSGCIRMSNDAITQIVEEIGLPLGTPVYIDEEE